MILFILIMGLSFDLFAALIVAFIDHKFLSNKHTFSNEKILNLERNEFLNLLSNCKSLNIKIKTNIHNFNNNYTNYNRFC